MRAAYGGGVPIVPEQSERETKQFSFVTEIVIPIFQAIFSGLGIGILFRGLILFIRTAAVFEVLGVAFVIYLGLVLALVGMMLLRHKKVTYNLKVSLAVFSGEYLLVALLMYVLAGSSDKTINLCSIGIGVAVAVFWINVRFGQESTLASTTLLKVLSPLAVAAGAVAEVKGGARPDYRTDTPVAYQQYDGKEISEDASDDGWREDDGSLG